MKKIMAVILALVLSLTVLAIPALAASKQIVWSFHEAGHTGQEGWSEYAMTHDPQGNSDTVYDADNGMVKVVVSEGKTSDTMYLSFSAEEYIDPATHKFVKFRMDGDFEYEFNINLWLRENQTWNINDLGNIGEFFGKDTVLNLDEKLYDYANIGFDGSSIRFMLQAVSSTFSQDMQVGDWFGVEYVAFFETEAEANAFDYDAWVAEQASAPESSAPESSAPESSKPSADTGHGTIISGAVMMFAAAAAAMVFSKKSK